MIRVDKQHQIDVSLVRRVDKEHETHRALKIEIRRG